jgi:sortase (surface protein transpeptidase)
MTRAKRTGPSRASVASFVGARPHRHGIPATAFTLLVILAAAGVGSYEGLTLTSGRVLPPPTAPRGVRNTVTRGAPPVAIAGSHRGGVAQVNLSTASSAGSSVARPDRLLIPAIGVATSVVALGENPDGSAEVPTGTTYASWYDLGPSPGAIGPAVMLGHVDSLRGEGVFFFLDRLLPGDQVVVVDGSTRVTFTVTRIVTYQKNHFPTGAVFGATPDAELRLITCGGPFDRSIGHYEDNVVVYATLA